MGIKIIITCWKTLAETMAFVFKKSFSENDYIVLQQYLEREMIILSQVIYNLYNLYT
jgi:hypothetical protein